MFLFQNELILQNLKRSGFFIHIEYIVNIVSHLSKGFSFLFFLMKYQLFKVDLKSIFWKT